jgi:Uma2 family endonuclease
MASTTHLLTAEEFYAMPDVSRNAELVRGEIVMMTPAGFRHGMVCVNIGFELKIFLKDHPLGVAISNDPGVITERNPDSVRGPDVAYFSYARLPKGSVPIGFSEISPEVAFEVKSPSNSWSELQTKAAEYLKAGTIVVCVVDPDTETATVFSDTVPPKTLSADDTLTFEAVLPGFAVPVCKFFAD